jgi:hypothetical protein
MAVPNADLTKNLEGSEAHDREAEVSGGQTPPSPVCATFQVATGM